MCSSDCFLAILAILFPPLPVWVKRGICSADSLISIALCCLGWFPGLLHSWYIISKYPDPWDNAYMPLGHESQGTTYYYQVAHPQHPPHPYTHQPRPQYQQPNPQYSTFESGNPGPAGAEHGQPQYTIIQPVPTSPAPAGSRQPERYTSHEQQTPPETPMNGPGGEGSSTNIPSGEPPSYASIIRGDHKIQTDD
ncbi:hypothetical protein L873DRAFT_1824725 [Choiromyces venosus 120613-1]|uniref:Uncharacterized protein n=1 Tax=Choiromyces venosus 120613-1 TaxID=1336337 RepID=A0A3N4K5Y9_9PEZI|nr:hypothetical protein L873DRAFT_1824725 [Choiromyces venosus 120613-1]